MKEDAWRKMEHNIVQQPQRETVERVAVAFDLPIDTVLQIAGLLPDDDQSYPNLPGRSLAQYAGLPTQYQQVIQELIQFYWQRYVTGMK